MKGMRAILLAPALAGLVFAGCNRPDEETCRQAVENIQRVARAGDRVDAADTEAAVRSCRANADKESVRCMINARTMEDLAACEGDLADDIASSPDDGS